VIVVVADTAPLRYLIQIDCHEFLAVLFKQVLIPIAVWEELRDEKAPLAVRLWAEQPPGWMKTCRINSTPGEDLWELDDGEREAIQLAEEVGADLLLVDERAGARIARQKGLSQKSFSAARRWLGKCPGCATLFYVNKAFRMGRKCAPIPLIPLADHVRHSLR
jgi:predicted nucleic acid-binding protein